MFGRRGGGGGTCVRRRGRLGARYRHLPKSWVGPVAPASRSRGEGSASPREGGGSFIDPPPPPPRGAHPLPLMPVPEVPGSPGAWDVPGAGREDGQGRGRPRSPGGLRLRCPSTFRGVPPPAPSLLHPWVLAGRLSGTSLDPPQLSRPYPGGINFPGAGPRRLSRDPPPAELPAGASLPCRAGSAGPRPGAWLRPGEGPPRGDAGWETLGREVVTGGSSRQVSASFLSGAPSFRVREPAFPAGPGLPRGGRAVRRAGPGRAGPAPVPRGPRAAEKMLLVACRETLSPPAISDPAGWV